MGGILLKINEALVRDFKKTLCDGFILLQFQNK